MQITTTVPFGPQHPILPEPVHVKCELEEEKVVSVSFEVGYAHRGMEKALETDYMKGIYLSERICGICSNIHTTTYVNAIEKIIGIEAHKRAKYIRTIMAELERLHSHLLWLGHAGEAVGFENLFMRLWDAREIVMDTLEFISGNRVQYAMNTIGGVRRDITPKKEKMIEDHMNRLEEKMIEIKRDMLTDYLLKRRTAGVGVLKKEDAVRLGTVGPNARASGVPWDLRMTRYEAYEYINFRPIVLEGGDNLSRVIIRVEESFQAIDIIRQCLNQMTPGRTWYRYRHEVSGEAVARTEPPRGELFYYIKGNGTNVLERVKIRTPTFMNLMTLPTILMGLQFADVPITILSIDPCFSCTDR